MMSILQRYVDTPKKAIFFIMMVAALSHGLFWLILPESLVANQSADFRSFYEPVARRLLQGEGLTLPEGQLAVRYPPGYPILLAAVFGLAEATGVAENVVLSLFLLLCLGGTAVFIYLLARELWGHWWGFLPALVWMSYPFTLWLGKQPNSEIPFLVLFYGGFYIFWRIIRHPPAWYCYLLCGLLLGCAMLIRPAAIGLPILLALILWFMLSGQTRQTRMCAIALLFVGIVALILPWEWLVYAQSGKTIALSSGGEASIRDGLTFAANDKGYREAILIPSHIQVLTNDLLRQAQLGRMSELGDILAVLREELRERPLTLVSLYLFKALRSWYATDSGRFELPSMILQSLYLVVIVIGSWQSWHQGGQRRQMTLIIWLITAYFWLITITVLSILRYILPAIGLLFLLLPGILVRDGRSSST
jgi:4-amino-4-deoxy-L-arabinose transferase-like glycosyltransferase